MSLEEFEKEVEYFRQKLSSETEPEGQELKKFFDLIKVLDFTGMGNVNVFSLIPLLLSRINTIKTIVEIGTWKGSSIASLGHFSREQNIKLYCVDHWKEPLVFEIFKNNMKKLGLEEIVIPIKMESEKAALQFKDESIDFIFIDGDHLYEGFKKDVLSWYPKLKTGSIFCGHDCDCYYDDLSDKQKQDVEELKNSEDMVMVRSDHAIHPGVVKGMYDFFGRDFKTKHNIWYLIKYNQVLRGNG